MEFMPSEFRISAFRSRNHNPTLLSFCSCRALAETVRMSSKATHGSAVPEPNIGRNMSLLTQDKGNDSRIETILWDMKRCRM